MSRSLFPSPQPRRGQALLLAVVIMIFAALLSASFIAIVSVNLNQTARQTDKNRAVVSARAGIDYVKRQLAYSNEGEKWRPQVENLPPASTDPAYNFYYTALDRAQGWAGQYAKFPDPRTETGTSAGPQFLAKVETIGPSLPASDPDISRFDLYGTTRISVVGLSPEDPSAYSRSVAYFGGYKNAPVGQTARTVSNWDFGTGKTLVAKANPATGDGTGTTLGIVNAQGDFSKLGRPFAITISNSRDVTPPITLTRSAVVTDVARTNSTTFVLTLAQPTTLVDADDRIDVSANLGAPQGIDYDNISTTTTTAFSTNTSGLVRLSDGLTGPTTNQVDGARINNSLVWSGDLLTTKLRSMNAAFTVGQAPGSIFVSGLIAFDTAAGTPQVDFAKASDAMPLGRLKASDASGIFTAGDDYQIISDSWNRLSGTVGKSGIRDVPNFSPPVIDSGQNLERYRNLTRFSTPVTPAIPGSGTTFPVPASASLNGYGQGIYIDNVQDKERTVIEDFNHNGALDAGEDVNNNGALDLGVREMTQSDLIKMWQSPQGGTGAFVRIPAVGTTIPLTTAANASLEEQHLRGWISATEFRARGVEIELDNGRIFITRDARDDNKTIPATASLNAFGPVDAKAWKDNTNTIQTGIYRKEFPWPANGVIFAEGNVRIKGNATFAPRSLTVVSMGNIYIEDSVSAAPDANADNDLTTPAGQPRKILLLAKKNVVMNPTRALGQPDAQTLVDTAGVFTPEVPPASAGLPIVPATQTLTLENADEMRIGDVVELGDNTNKGTTTNVAQITNITAPSVTLTFLRTPATAVVTGSFIRTRSENDSLLNLPLNSATPFRFINGADASIQRRFTLPAASSTVRVAFNHGADRVDAFNVKIKPDATGNTIPTSGVFLSNKRVITPGPLSPPQNFISTATTVDQNNKRLRVNYNDPAPPSTDEFPASVTTEPNAQNYVLSSLKSDMDSRAHPPTSLPTVGWTYDTQPVAAYATIPSFFLAGIGNRYDFVATTPTLGGGPIGWQNNIVGSDLTEPSIVTNGFNMPLATSIGVWLNNTVAPATMLNEHYNTTTSAYDQTQAFGFNPTFLDGGVAREDILTGDQGFYQDITPANSAVKSTLDSRYFGTLAAGQNGFSLRQNSYLSVVPTSAVLPDYRVLGMKLEDVTLNPNADTIASIRPGYNFNVNAFVYAQTGSWFVISTPMFDSRLRGNNISGTYLDLNNNGNPDANEQLGAAPNNYADLNRNGIIEDSERYAMDRYSRYNYQINFTGAISENQTPLVNDVIVGTTKVATGSVASWMDSYATTTLIIPPPATPPPTNDRMRYIFDPTVVLGGFQKDNPLTPAIEPTDVGFRLPQTPEVFNIS